MNNVRRISLLVLFLSLPLLFTACARSGSNRQIDSLQAQIGVLTDEVVRIDEGLQDTRAALQMQESRQYEIYSKMDTVKQSSSAMYRTPSGFEIPALSLQEALKNAGYYKGTLDGKIGSGTREAIKNFQRDNGLKVDGVCGRNTWERLKVYLRGSIK